MERSARSAFLLQGELAVNDVLLTKPQLKALLGVAEVTLGRIIVERQVPIHRLRKNTHPKFRLADVERLVSQSRVPGEAMSDEEREIHVEADPDLRHLRLLSKSKVKELLGVTSNRVMDQIIVERGLPVYRLHANAHPKFRLADIEKLIEESEEP